MSRTRTRSLTSAILLLIFVLAGCAVPNLLRSPDLSARNQILEVTGRQSLKFWDRKMTVGPYRTENLKPGWATDSQWNVGVKIRSAGQDISFDLLEPTGQAMTVRGTQTLKSVAVDLINGWIELPLRLNDVFTGELRNADGSGRGRFLLYDLNLQTLSKRKNVGAFEWQDERFDVVRIQELDKRSIFSPEGYGFEVIQQGRALLAVETFNNGRVYLDPSLTPAKRHAMVSFASALMLRQDL